ncbi:MAG: hypothetical protein WCL06_11125, partial [Bacteroidota bacterium]
MKAIFLTIGLLLGCLFLQTESAWSHNVSLIDPGEGSFPEKVKGSFTGCNVYKYGYKNGVLLTNTKFRYNFYKFNDNGSPTEHVYYKPGSTASNRETFKYNDKGKLKEQTDYFMNGTISGRTTYTYDLKGNLIETVWYEGEDVVTNKEKYSYDSQNNLIEEIHYFGLKEITGKELYT